jgi:hypothetical protein
MRFHQVFFECQHEIWSKQHNGKVSYLKWILKSLIKFIVFLFFTCVFIFLAEMYYRIRMESELINLRTTIKNQQTLLSIYEQQRGNHTDIPMAQDVRNWKIYIDQHLGISFLYPTGWKYSSPVSSESSIIAFTYPGGTGDKNVDFLVSLSLTNNDFDSVAKKYAKIYKQEVGQNWIVYWSGLKFTHKDGGVYVMQNNGKTIDVHYAVANGRSYGPEAVEMIRSLTMITGIINK